MHAGEKSDSVILPEKLPNKAECRGGNGGKDAGQGKCGREKRAPDTVAGTSAPSDLDRIRHQARDGGNYRPRFISSLPKAGAVCDNLASTDLRGGPGVSRVPTAMD